MTDALHAGLEVLPLDDAPRIDRVCDAFEAAWRDGRRPPIEEYAGPEADALLCELVCVDVEYRRAAGDKPTVEEYRARFPALDSQWLQHLLVAPVGPPPPGSMSAANRLGRFELLTKVGQGACGTVWRAFDPRLNRIVALKVPHPGLVGSPEAVERFRREAQTAAGLRHPGIVAVHDVAIIDGTPVLVQDFLHGVSLREKIATDRPTMNQAAALTAEVAEALEYAHRQGAVHRDIKPANIVVTLEGRAVIVDFGLALQDGGSLSLTADGQILGTPAYMSPEQASGRAHIVDARSDVYSLGVVLYELLTGHPPFQESRAVPLLRRVIEDEPRPPRKWDDHISRDLETICLRAMAKEPHRRYRTAGEFAADLRRYLAGTPVLARPTSQLERSVRWVKRNPVRAALVVVSVIAAMAVVGATVAWAYNSRLELANTAIQNARNDEATQHRETQSAYYFQRLAMASREWSLGNAGRVEQILLECPKSLRGWEWNYLNGLTHRDLLTIKNYDDTDKSQQLSGLAYSPNGLQLASTSWDGKVRIFAPDGRKLAEHKLFDWGAQSLAWHPDGRRLAVGSVFGRIFLVNAENGEILRTFQDVGFATYRVAFRPDGHHLATAGGEGPWEATDSKRRSGEVRIWDVATGREVLQLKQFAQSVTGLAYHPSGERFVTCEGAITTQGDLGRPGVVSVWDAMSGQRVWKAVGHDGPTTAVAFSPDGRTLASGGWDRSVVLWNADTGTILNTLVGHRDWVRALAFSPDGIHLASAGTDSTINIWNSVKGRSVRRLRGHTQSVTGVMYHPSNGQIATCSADKTVKIWDPSFNPEARVLKGADPMTAVAFAPDGSVFSAGYVAKSGRDPLPAVTVWDPATGAVRQRIEGHTERILALAISADGRRLATGGRDRVLRLWSIPDDDSPIQLEAKQGEFNSIIRGVALRPDRRTVAIAGMRSVNTTMNFDELYRWDIAGQRELERRSSGGKGSLNAASYSPNGEQLAVATNGQFVVIWDEDTGLEIARLDGHTRTVTGLAYSSNGRFLATCSQDNSARIWDLVPLRRGEDAHLVAVLLGHSRGVTAIAFSPDGSRVATASDDATVKIWDVHTGQEALTLTGHTDAVTGVAFSPDNRRLASSSHDGSVRIWETYP